jgi:hypothetical protein
MTISSSIGLRLLAFSLGLRVRLAPSALRGMVPSPHFQIRSAIESLLLLSIRLRLAPTAPLFQPDRFESRLGQAADSPVPHSVRYRLAPTTLLLLSLIVDLRLSPAIVFQSLLSANSPACAFAPSTCSFLHRLPTYIGYLSLVEPSILLLTCVWLSILRRVPVIDFRLSSGSSVEKNLRSAKPVHASA